MDEHFVKVLGSCNGAKVIYMIQTATGYITHWKEDQNRSHFLGGFLVRDPFSSKSRLGTNNATP
jgi:hypothetical protein